MHRLTLAATLLALGLAAAACRTGPSNERLDAWGRGDLVLRTTRAYHVISSAHKGKVGYVKVEDVTEAGGPSYPWKYVYDADWRELGFVDQFGNAYAYHVYSPSEQAQQNLPLRAMRLPSDSIQQNAMRMLGIDPSADDVTFLPATQGDITGDRGMHLAGPGIVPAMGSEAKAAEPAR